jgi:glucosamine-phosphate N-acetyltransferase
MMKTVFLYSLQIRPLASSDYERGHLTVLQALTETPDPGKDAYIKQFQLMKNSQPASYYVLAIVNTETDKIVAVGSLFLEFKFIRNLGSAGHIEDIAVDTTVQGKGLGKKMINALTLLSESLGAYKVILDCSTDNQGEFASVTTYNLL